MKVVTATPVRMSISGTRVVDQTATASAAMAAAVRALGDENWEMIGAAQAYAHRPDLEALHFKRSE